MKSIMQTDRRCYICGATEGLERHHVMGAANRKLSEKCGLVIWLCLEHHRGTNGAHGKNGNEVSKWLKREAQRKFEETHSREEWMKIFGRNYL